MSQLLESTKYFVLLAVADGPAHGTAVRKRIVGDASGVYLRDSTLYASIKSLRAAGLIEEIGNGHSYRRTYQLTAKGARQLMLEARMHKRAAELALQRLGLD